jgi:hypothetical protein
MARKYARRHSPEQIIGKLRDAEVDLASGLTVGAPGQVLQSHTSSRRTGIRLKL